MRDGDGDGTNAIRRRTRTRTAMRREIGATEQPGNSFRYLYWRLSEKEFQQLCAAILRDRYDSVRCFPVGMADEGIDVISADSIIYQVKWTSKFQQSPHTWLSGAIKGERHNIEKLIQQGRISRYILITSVAGTTTAEQNGSIQQLDLELQALSRALGIPIEVWWQSDLDALVDFAPDEIKWAYQEMLAGSDAVRYLMSSTSLEGRASRMRETLQLVLAEQWRRDGAVKFSRADRDRVNLSAIFVDIKVEHQEDERFSFLARTRGPGAPTGGVKWLLGDSGPATFLLGVPGQGKSTLSQYLCQVHRAAILPKEVTDGDETPSETPPNPKVPIRIDLTDFAAWLSGGEPFLDEEGKGKRRTKSRQCQSLEAFLAEFSSWASGGRDVSVEDIHSFMARFPLLLALDGLDEIADENTRSKVVKQIDEALSRLTAQRLNRDFQVIVTSRPNSSGLAEPTSHLFSRLRLVPMEEDLQQQYLEKWCDANDLDGRERKDLRRIFRDRTSASHVSQLADNPMQLSILLFLISRRGEAVPVARTALYTAYMEVLMDREVNRKQIERHQVGRVHEVTSFLGWFMHAGVESHTGASRMARDDIETTLMVYFRRTGGPVDEVSALFRAATDRFWALTSEVDGTFEFAIQPVREYFAARFLAQWAGRDLPAGLSKQVTLRELVGRPFWLNVARFYAGFASPNELAALRYGLEDAIDLRVRQAHHRAAVWALVSDGVFADDSRVQRDVLALVSDDLSLALMESRADLAGDFRRLPHESARKEFARILFKRVSGDNVARSRRAVHALRAQAGVPSLEFQEWWTPQLQDAAGTQQEEGWLVIGADFGGLAVDNDLAGRLSLASVGSRRAALALGVGVTGSEQGRILLRTVLDGHASDVRSSATTESGALLRAMRPQWFQGPHFQAIARGGSHLQLRDLDKSERVDAWKRLVAMDSGYRELRAAVRAGQMGQKGTTEPWQRPARTLASLHGPCWLASEIAVSGAARRDLLASGTKNPDGDPFGSSIDYGTLVSDLHRLPSESWWDQTYTSFPDDLSRRTWVLAIVATASESVLASQLERVASATATFASEDFWSLAASCSRVSRSPGRRSVNVFSKREGPVSNPRVALLLSYFSEEAGGGDAINTLSNQALLTVASMEGASWPVVVSVAKRMRSSPSADLLEVLRRSSPEGESALDESLMGAIPETYLEDMVQNAAAYPLDWVAASEARLSSLSRATTLERHALAEKWLPKIPRLD